MPVQLEILGRRDKGEVERRTRQVDQCILRLRSVDHDVADSEPFERSIRRGVGVSQETRLNRRALAELHERTKNREPTIAFDTAFREPRHISPYQMLAVEGLIELPVRREISRRAHPVAKSKRQFHQAYA